MLQLNLPTYDFRIKKQEEKYLIFDIYRKKYVYLTPEEWVRQNFMRYLIEEKGFPANHIAIEKQILINGLKKRFDALVYDKDIKPLILIEFKSPDVEITQKTFDQAAVYNSKINVEYFIISNGLQHYFCKLDRDNSKYIFSNEIPIYETIKKS
jgi:type I site-specific restriction endonuclease